LRDDADFHRFLISVSERKIFPAHENLVPFRNIMERQILKIQQFSFSLPKIERFSLFTLI